MGGMASTIPIKDDPTKNAIAIQKIEQDKLREVMAGHDGTWVAHPALVNVARAVFDNHMTTPNQIDVALCPEGANVTQEQLLQLPSVPKGQAITSHALKKGIAIVLAYTEAWLRGIGCIPLNHHMEDAATAEISRAQIWQWRFHGVVTQDDGMTITKGRISQLVHANVKRNTGGEDVGKYFLAGKLVEVMLTKDTLGMKAM